MQIGSTILAQAAGVPTLPWSGSGVAMAFTDCKGVIPEETYKKACVHSLEEAIEACQKIGYPIMLKASWGGGGKGIRKVHNDEEVQQVFKQIQGEVSRRRATKGMPQGCCTVLLLGVFETAGVVCLVLFTAAIHHFKLPTIKHWYCSGNACAALQSLCILLFAWTQSHLTMVPYWLC